MRLLSFSFSGKSLTNHDERIIIIALIAFFLYLLFIVWAFVDIFRNGFPRWRDFLWPFLLALLVMLLSFPAVIGISVTAPDTEKRIIHLGGLISWLILYAFPASVFLLAMIRINRRIRRYHIPHPMQLTRRLYLKLKNLDVMQYYPIRLNFLEAFLYLSGMIVSSLIWLQISVHQFDAQMHELLRMNLPSDPNDLDATTLFHLLPLLLLAPLLEEIVYRGYIQDRVLLYLRSKRIASGAIQILLAASIASCVWAFQHVGMIEPEFVKFVQIFMIGIFLGLARMRLGLEACILLHFLFNCSSALITPKELMGFMGMFF